MKVTKLLSQSNLFGTIQPPQGVPSGNNALSNILSAGIKMFFIVAGLAALLYLLLGAFDWITSGGEKEKIMKAQSKIQNAIVGLILMFVVLAGLVTLERVAFKCKFCFGLSCPIQIPKLGQPSTVKGCK